MTGSVTNRVVQKVKSLNGEKRLPEDIVILYKSTTDDVLDEDTISNQNKYDISFEYKDAGYISTVIIEGAPRPKAGDESTTESVAEENDDSSTEVELPEE